MKAVDLEGWLCPLLSPHHINPAGLPKPQTQLVDTHCPFAMLFPLLGVPFLTLSCCTYQLVAESSCRFCTLPHNRHLHAPLLLCWKHSTWTSSMSFTLFYNDLLRWARNSFVGDSFTPISVTVIVTNLHWKLDEYLILLVDPRGAFVLFCLRVVIVLCRGNRLPSQLGKSCYDRSGGRETSGKMTIFPSL